jgi:IclR family acetate operon transcriptional repressor
MTPRTHALEKAFALLTAVAESRGSQSLPVLAERTQLPLSTAHRLIATLEGLGLIVREKKGRYFIGPVVMDLIRNITPHDVMARVSRPFLRDLARRYRMTVHLAVYEGDMVTYLAKESVGRSTVQTMEGAQLEAYCSGLGKVLLAHLPERDRERYLAAGPFVALTANTITDPAALREELHRIIRRGYALDDGEILETLKCVAVPLKDQHGRTCAALSLSGRAEEFTPKFIREAVAVLKKNAADISERLFPHANGI